jgi:hypothetical protein
MYCSTQTRYRTIMADDINLTSLVIWAWPCDGPRGFESKLFIILALAGKPFSQWSNLHASTSICSRTTRLSPKKFLDDKPIFHLEILQNIILKVFPYLNDRSTSDLLRSCPRVSVLQIMIIIEDGQWSNRFSIRILRSCPRVLTLQRLINNLTVW